MASDRLFIPPRIEDSTPTDIIFRQERRPFSNIRKRRGGVVKVGRHIAISVGGACYENGTSWARGGSGVYFGPRSPHNFSEALDEDGPQTSHRAEINAAIIALDKVKELLDQEKLDTSLVLLISDSKYLVEGITQNIYKWQDNGWRTRRGEVVNKEDFEELDELVDELEDDYEVFVKFWWVPKEENEAADQLAEQAVGFYGDEGSDEDYD